MSINNAMKVLKRIQTDADFRQSLYKCNSAEEIVAFLDANLLNFTSGELEAAYTSLLVKCQFEDQANRLKDALQCMIMLNNQYGFI